MGPGFKITEGFTGFSLVFSRSRSIMQASEPVSQEGRQLLADHFNQVCDRGLWDITKKLLNPKPNVVCV